MNGLLKRRAELAVEIERTHQSLHKLIFDLEVLDATIAQLDPTFSPVKPRAFRPPADWSHRGEMSRVVLNILRMASEPMTIRDIALELLVTRALDKSDQKLLRLMARRVGAALRHQRDMGVVTSIPGPGQYALWTINPERPLLAGP